MVWRQPPIQMLPYLFLLLLLLAFTTHLRDLASSFLRFRDHTQWHNIVSRTPGDDRSPRRRDLYLTNTQHSQQTNIHAPGGIRTCNPSRRAAVDPRLRPLGHWDRLVTFLKQHILSVPYHHTSVLDLNVSRLPASYVISNLHDCKNLKSIALP
jgi:hypothetical protein